MNKDDPFELPLEVRGYEMDAFGHVNNAVYVQYFEHIRWKALRQLGDDWLQPGGLHIVVSNLEIDFKAPAEVFEELIGRLWVQELGLTSVTFHQEVVRKEDDRTLAVGEVVAVCVDEDGRPHRMPDDWRETMGGGD